jgi:hypothetical protein
MKKPKRRLIFEVPIKPVLAQQKLAELRDT